MAVNPTAKLAVFLLIVVAIGVAVAAYFAYTKLVPELESLIDPSSEPSVDELWEQDDAAIVEEEIDIDIDADSEERYRELGRPTKNECEGVFTLDAFQSCKGGTQAGIGWNWMHEFDKETGIGWRCQNISTDHYIVTFKSEKFPDLVLKQKLKGNKMSTGIADIGKQFFDGTSVTFTIMPKDEDGKDVLKGAVEYEINDSTGSGSCKDVGINPYPPMYWTEGKNILSVKGTNTGPNDIYIKSYLKDARDKWHLLDQGRTRGKLWAWTPAASLLEQNKKTVWVPEGGRVCFDTVNGTTRCRYWDDDGNGGTLLEYMQSSSNAACKDLKSYDEMSPELLRNQTQRLHFADMKGFTGKQTSINKGDCGRK